MNGPVIAERGAVVWLPSTGEILVSKAEKLFTEIREKVVLTLGRLEGCCVFVGDALTFAEEATGVEGCAILTAIDEYRRCSLGAFIRKVADGQLIRDRMTAGLVADRIRSVIPEHPLVSPATLDKEYSLLLVHANDADKGRGLREVGKHMQDLERVVMIGNSMSDLVDFPSVEHWAVENADPAFKTRASEIALSGHTKGCVEILRRLKLRNG
jgi:hypothetical protein